MNSILLFYCRTMRLEIAVFFNRNNFSIPFTHYNTFLSITNTQIGSIFNISSDTLHQIRSEDSLLYKSHLLAASTQVIIHHKLEILLYGIPDRLALICNRQNIQSFHRCSAYRI